MNRCATLLLLLATLQACSPPNTPETTEPRPADGIPGEVRALPPGTANPQFLTRREYPAYGRPEGLTAVDLDGDGRAELAATTVTPPALLLWSSRAGDLGAVPRRAEVGGYPLAPVMLAPAANAGAGAGSWIAVASREERSLRLYDGSLELRQQFELSATPRALAAGDLSGDGSTELLVATDRELLGFSMSAPLFRAELPALRPTTVCVVNRGTEVAVGMQADRSLHVLATRALLESPDTANSGTAARVVPLGGIPRDLIPTADGLLAVGGDSELWHVRLLEGSDEVRARSTHGRVPIFAAVARSDSHAPTLVAVHDSSLTWTSSPLTASETAPVGTPPALSGYCGQAPTGAALADFDGDGVSDLVIANRDAACLSLFAGRPSGTGPDELLGFAQPTRVRIGSGALALAALPRLDAAAGAAVARATDGTVAIVRSINGELSQLEEHRVGPSPRSVRSADWSGDGRLDLVVLVQYADEARAVFLRADSEGGFELAPELELGVGASAAEALFVDPEGDGTPDLVVADPDGGRLLWLRNAGQLDNRSTALLELEGRPVSLGAGDLGAGRIELLVALAGDPNAPHAGARIEAHDWSWPGAPTAVHPLEGAPVQLVVADVDGDGADEVSVLTRRAPPARSGNVQILGRKGAHFATLARTGTGLDPRHLNVADLDADGWCELLIACRGSHDVGLLRLMPPSAESATAWSLASLPDLGADLGPMASAVADFDGDGRVDVLVANVFSEALSLIRGR